jgi:prophage regulatory protein
VAPTLERIILDRDLPKYVGLKETRRDELIAQGKFPPPVKLSDRRKGWLESEILAWQQARISERDYAFAPKAHETAEPQNQKRWQPPSSEK